MSGRTCEPHGMRSIISSSLSSIASESIAAAFATWVCAAPINSRCLVAARSRNTRVAVSTSEEEDSRKGKVTSWAPSLLRLRAAAKSHKATPNPAIAVGPGWRVLAKSSAPRHESSDTPTRDAASDARFEGVRFERSVSTVSPICERNRFAWASYSPDVSAILELSQQRRELRDALRRSEPSRFQTPKTGGKREGPGCDCHQRNDQKREVYRDPKAS